MKSCKHRGPQDGTHFGPQCPGCPQFELNYSAWMEEMSTQVDAAIRGYNPEILPAPSDLQEAPQRHAYRHRCRWVVGTPNEPLGFYQAGGKAFIGIEDCLMHTPHIEEASERIREFLRANPKACEVFNFIDIRYDGTKTFVTFCTTDKTPDRASELVSSITSIKNIAINYAPKGATAIMSGTQLHIQGEAKLNWTLNGKQFESSPQSFFQVNPSVLELMHTHIRKYLATISFDNVYDFYCGIGVHSLGLNTGQNIIGFDSSESAIADANKNGASILGENVKREFLVKKDSTEDLPSPPINCVGILNPARAGLSGSLIPFLANKNFTDLVYISCNPVTLYRDMDRLHMLGYEVVEVKGFEMMPRSSHVELVAFLKRIGPPRYDQAGAFWPPSRGLTLGISGPISFQKDGTSFWIARVKGTVPKGRPPGGKSIFVKRLRKVGNDSIVTIRTKKVDEVEILEAFDRWKYPILGKVGGRIYDRPLLHCVKSAEIEAPIPGFIVSMSQLPVKVLEKDHFTVKKD